MFAAGHLSARNGDAMNTFVFAALDAANLLAPVSSEARRSDEGARTSRRNWKEAIWHWQTYGEPRKMAATLSVPLPSSEWAATTTVMSLSGCPAVSKRL